MKIHYMFDDSAARLPLTIRSSEGVWDRSVDLRAAPSVQLVELATQHLLNTGLTLVDELTRYFDDEATTESDPYDLDHCYENRALLEDLLRDIHNRPPDSLVALNELEALFPVTFMAELNFTLALTVVGVPAFGYVRTYSDSEGDEFHGMVVNLAQAHPHLDATFGHFSLPLLLDTIRYSFFNHEAFHIAYDGYTRAIGRTSNRPLDRLKDALVSRGIAWYLSYRHNLTFYDRVLGFGGVDVAHHVAQWNRMVETARRKNQTDPVLDDWTDGAETHQPAENSIDMLGFFAARAIAEQHHTKGLRDAITTGPDHFIQLYNELSDHTLLG